MEWLQQNWTHLLLLAGVILFLCFGGMGRACYFEAAPDQYATAPSDGEEAAGHHPHGGCC